MSDIRPNHNRPNRTPLALALLACVVPTTDLLAQEQPDPARIERLRRDQDEILRKAERLQELMKRLQSRYEREGKQEQVDFLKEGLAHLEKSGILGDVASIREDLESTAFTEALRKQREVVADLERLLNILLARKSIENLDEEIEKVAERAKTASELERRQQELIDQRRDAMRSELSEQEQQIADQLAQLRDEERREADRNAQQAGTRRPFLESALDRVKQLLNNQNRLEAGLDDEQAGRTPKTQETAFDLGELSQQLRELQRGLRGQQTTQKIGKAGKQLEEAANGDDQQALQQARDELDRLLENPGRTPAPIMPDASELPKKNYRELRDEVRKAEAADTEAGKEQLRDAGQTAQQSAQAFDKLATKANGAETERLKQAADVLATQMARDAADDTAAKPEGKRSSDTVEDAAKKLGEAKDAIEKGDTKEANKKVNEALSAIERARQQHRAENPDAERNAGKMASDARSAAQDLANIPDPDEGEKQAGEALKDAAEALRDVEEKVSQARQDGKRPDASQQAQQSRQALESARDALQQALSQAAENNQAELEAAAERQQELSQQAEQAKQQLDQAQQSGDINKQQRDAAQKQIERAQQAMQQAQQQLQQGKQASAAQKQQQASEAMQQAMDALQQNRKMTEQQKQQLADQAKAQEQLTEDIIRLAEELKKSNNKEAERAVQEAAEASQKAQRAMEQGDSDEADRQQEEAREKLEEATDALEEEQDRYQDLRQEELLFKMIEELTTFLEKQRPITLKTKEYQEAAKTGRLSRPARNKVNGLGEEEQGLAGKVEFLVNALSEEGNLVYRAVLEANLEDLREVTRRLSGRRPDVGSFTTLMQEDVERRTEQLLDALERERKRKEQERQQQQQQQQQDQGENKFNPQREKLVSLIADLEMLKSLGQDTGRATEDLRTLVEARGDDTISDAEVDMIQRLHHRHNEITKLFEQIKAGVEQALQQGQEEESEGGN